MGIVGDLNAAIDTLHEGYFVHPDSSPCKYAGDSKASSKARKNIILKTKI